MSMPAVMGIVGALVEEGIVRETVMGESTGGRRPMLLEIVPEAYRAIGLEVGTLNVTAIATNLDADTKFRVEVPSRMSSGPEEFLTQIASVIGELLEAGEGGSGEVLGIGLALPGPLLASRELVFSPPSYPGWGEVRPGEVIAEEFGLPVLVDNDANAAALGEHLFGAGREAGEMFYVVAHRGVGGAMIIDGELYRGADGGAGELGHTLVDPEGPLCGCGRVGCLEAFAGRAAIARRVRRALALSGKSRLPGKAPEETRAKDVIDAGLAGDELSVGILEETGRYLGLGISNAIDMLDPELVVLGGSTMRAGELVRGPAEEVVRERARPGLAGRVRLVTGELAENAGAVGAASLVLSELFASGGSVCGESNTRQKG